jgi:hypothetical protein
MNIVILSPKNIHNTISQIGYIYNNQITFIGYDNIADYDFNNLKKYDYIILMNKLFYINYQKLFNFLLKNSIYYAGIKSYWGVGSFELGIINTKTDFDKINKDIAFLYDEENLFYNLLATKMKVDNIESLLSIKSSWLKQQLVINNIIDISKYIFSKFIKNTTGQYHDAMFVHVTDYEDYFIEWVRQYHNKTKDIFYKNRVYKTVLGINYFLIKNKEIVMINKNIFVFWDKKTNRWKKIKSDKNVEFVKGYIKLKLPQVFQSLLM